ncbi:hypothetical protein DVP78_06515 [Yersinia enterocolitica]|nr:hypothetical protein [Yersinia enterocolitica]EKN6040223.1 hypothetical protein [Yersinia enterocolitica]EKN6344884.1 hypothetical protein [Yersinia enterocolitica]EKN6392097.1 hypothetical protein [Yersinia enterocolitica]
MNLGSARILTYYVYAPVALRCPCSNCLQQLRLIEFFLRCFNQLLKILDIGFHTAVIVQPQRRF